MTQFHLNSEKQFALPGDAAVFYKSLGWEPLVLPAREKAPKGKWGTAVERSDEDLFFAYEPTSNVGIALGERSGGLIDIDNDWPEASLVSNLVFASYPSFGRATSQNSHRMVRGRLQKNRPFQIPADARDLFGADKDMVLELRGEKLQTMVPPSVHPNGERLRWHNDPRHIPEVDGEELERYAGCVAFLAVILNRYPRGSGNRDNVCLALTGTLVRAGFTDEEIDRWVAHIASLADDEGRDSGALILKDVETPWLREQFARTARWIKPTKDGFTRKDPPSDAATAYLARVGDWKLRFLQGITQSPTMRADGAVLQEPGYDPVSGLLYDPGQTDFPTIPDEPTLEEAKAALSALSRPFREFAFASEADRSVALVAVLTSLVRSMFSAAPLFAIDAPTAGSGKSLLAETIGIITTGHKPAMMSQDKSAEEDEKRLSSVLMAGDQVIVIDNCECDIEGDFLCSMLTQEMVQQRLLGKSEVRRLPTRCLVIATGNRLRFSGDISRRTLHCYLFTGVERPDQRQFDFDPRVEARRDRPLLVTAGLTILRAYLSNGCPCPLDKIGSFEQ